MQLKTLLRQPLLIVVFIGLIISSLYFFYFTPRKSILKNSESLIEDYVDVSNQEQEGLGLPLHLKIPVINVDATIEYVGLTSDGAMDVPKGPNDVAWFQLGVRPGETGSAVVSGHYGWKDNIPAVFDNLHKLQKGDRIYIEDDKGVIITFVVRESKLYNWDANASGVFDSSDGKAHLNLVTCEGSWDKVQRNYSNRLVVFADKE
jgi:LPXTG-site transpeptidase (sortase) family protein